MWQWWHDTPREKPVTVPLCPPQSPHRLAWNLTRALRWQAGKWLPDCSKSRKCNTDSTMHQTVFIFWSCPKPLHNIQNLCTNFYGLNTQLHLVMLYKQGWLLGQTDMMCKNIRHTILLIFSCYRKHTREMQVHWLHQNTYSWDSKVGIVTRL
jgi:hypothetical protein